MNLPDLRTTFGFGVAGNFAGHLEQAGEAADFVGIGSAEVEAPKGIFPWFAPRAADGPASSPSADGIDLPPSAGGVDSSPSADGIGAHPGEAEWAPAADGVPAFLRTYPITRGELVRPAGDEVNLQIEPEVGLLARVTYAEDGSVLALTPIAIGAFNDCSIRRAGAQKISHKKNWGARSKGLADVLLPIDDLAPDGPTATFRLACFLVRDGETLAYGVDSAVPEYSYYGDTLLEWIVDRLNHQAGAADSPLEPVGTYLRAAGNPDVVLVGIGATRYTPLGESTFLRIGDEAVVVVYDGARSTPDAVAEAIASGADATLLGASVLRQSIVGA